MPDERMQSGDLRAETVDLGAILGDLARELSLSAEKCTLLQEAISALLGKVDHPDLGAEIHMLQEVDRLQQTLADIAAIIAVTDPAGRGKTIPRDAIGGAIQLESLRLRLGLSNDPLGPLGEGDDTDITWL